MQFRLYETCAILPTFHIVYNSRDLQNLVCIVLYSDWPQEKLCVCVCGGGGARPGNI